jgi:hypothetical protein
LEEGGDAFIGRDQSMSERDALLGQT